MSLESAMRALILAFVLLAGCAPTMADRERAARDDARNQERLAVALAGLTPGQPRSCINLSDLRMANSETYGDTILYRVSRGLIYRNDTSGGCFGLSHDDIIVTNSIGSQMCRGDIVHTVDRGTRMSSGSCVFGDFVVYRK
jgi:hypothetical protein